MHDSDCDITDSTTATAAPSIHEDALIPGHVTHDVMSPLSHVVSVHAEAQPASMQLDIEHVVVQNDPREWSRRRKSFTLAMVASAAMIATLGINIYNPAINDIKAQLHATDQDISLSLAIFILVQGCSPLVWSAISEIRGRKFVYLISIALYVVGCGIAGSARSTGVLIAMRVVQAMGGSAVLTIGAATLADIYEPRERGTVVGIYYAAPLLGPSVGPIAGGVLTQLLNWRATFYFLSIFAGLSFIMLLFFRDTFRRERSLSYQSVLRRRVEEMHRAEKKRDEKHGDTEKDLKRTVTSPDLENTTASLATVRLSLRDVNPITPLVAVLRRRNNLAILFPSSLLFGFSYTITYTAVRTFAGAPYNYGALDIGLVLLSNGIGSMAGSIIGGRWSDHVLVKLKVANNGRTSSEDRLQSTKPMMILLPLSLVAYAWMIDQKVHVAAVSVVFAIVGFTSIWIYSSTLAYIVDANAGRSSTAVATNSFVRGFVGCVATEIAVPLQDALGDGGLYTLWAGLMVFTAGSILVTIAKGGRWREDAEARERGETGKVRKDGDQK